MLTMIKMKLGKYRIVQNIANTSFVKVMEEGIVTRYLNPQKGDRICNVACGSGVYCIGLAQIGCEVYGVDISEQSIAMAKAISKRQNCHFEVADAEALPFESESFNKVVCVCSLEHFENDEQALNEMNRVLKKNGIIVLSVDSFTYKGIKKDLLEKHRKDHHVVNYYTFSSLAEKMKTQGFTVEKYRYFVNSAVSDFFYKIGIRLKFGYFFKTIFPVAYPFSIISDKLWGKSDQGYRLAVKARKF
jgi:ubiquinone/menaquinone biosynthesis C-methylase UbiE